MSAGRRMRAAPFIIAATCALVAGACHHRADPRPPSAAVTPNAPRCSSIVARRNAGEMLTVQEGPKFDARPPRPAAFPRETWGREVEIRFRLTERGTVDSTSVSVVGVNDLAFVESVVPPVLALRARPGRYEGCWVPSWHRLRYPVRNDGSLVIWYGP